MFRAKVLIFMVPLVLPIGQPPARATDGPLEVIECAAMPSDNSEMDAVRHPGVWNPPGLVESPGELSPPRSAVPDTD